MGSFPIPDPLLPNCATPDAVYQIEGTSNGILVKIHLPVAGMWDRLTVYQQDLIRKRIHDAIIPSIESVYQMTWDECFAGKGNPPYPLSHAELYAPRGEPGAYSSPIQMEDR